MNSKKSKDNGNKDKKPKKFKERSLTVGEVRELKKIFGDSFPSGSVKVKKSFFFQRRNAYLTPKGHIHEPKNESHSDYSV